MALNQPDFRVTLDGQDLTDRLAPRLLSLRICERRGGEADQLDLVVHDEDGRMAIPKKGALLRVAIGWRSGPDVKPGRADKGTFKVDEAEHSGPPDQVTIRARSAHLSDAYRARREKSWRDTTLGAVIREIAAANGLAAKVAPSLAAIRVPVLGADQRSDMALIRFLGDRYDAIATVKNETLLFAPIGAGVTATGRALPVRTITRRDGDRHAFKVCDRDQYGGVEARWHDRKAAKRRTVAVDGAAAGGERKKPHRRLRRTYHSEAAARHACEAEHRRIQRAAATFSLTLAYGDASLSPEQAVTVNGWNKPEIDGRAWLISEATHQLGADGFTTALELESRA